MPSYLFLEEFLGSEPSRGALFFGAIALPCAGLAQHVRPKVYPRAVAEALPEWEL